jgi:hypothetical protein
MPRPVLDEAHLHPAIRERVGMAGNPHPKRARRQ